MSILGRIKQLIYNLSLTDEKAWNQGLWRLGGSQSISGEVVTESTALTYSAVYNAVSLISGTIGALPLHLMQRKGEKTQLADHKSLYWVMHNQWNPLMTAMAGREALTAHILTWGNGYAEIVRNGMGDITELWPITPNRIRPEMRNGELIYVIRVGNEEIILPRSRILHIPGLGFDGFQGYSVIAMARKSIGLGMALETFGALYFGQGTHLGMVVSHPNRLSSPAHDNLEKSLKGTHGGLAKAHKLFLLEEGMKIEKIGIPPNDSQFLESRQHQIPEIARWFNLPPHKLKDLTRSSFSNIESEQISFITDSILPWLVRLEQNYNMQLLSGNEQKRERIYFKHIVEGLLRGNAANRAAFYRVMFNIGAMNINEIREKEDLNPVAGGDEHFVPLNMVPLSMAKEQFKKKLEEPPPAPQLTAPEQVPKKGNRKDREAHGGQPSQGGAA